MYLYIIINFCYMYHFNYWDWIVNQISRPNRSINGVCNLHKHYICICLGDPTSSYIASWFYHYDLTLIFQKQLMLYMNMSKHHILHESCSYLYDPSFLFFISFSGKSMYFCPLWRVEQLWTNWKLLLHWHYNEMEGLVSFS